MKIIRHDKIETEKKKKKSNLGSKNPISEMDTFLSKRENANSEETKEKVNLDQIALTENVDRIELPSKYKFYDQKSINIRDLKFRELASMTAAARTESTRNIVEAMARCVLDFDVLDMTYGDWIASLFMLRSQMKEQLIVDWACESDKHKQMIEDAKNEEDKQYLTDQLIQSSTITNESLSLIDFDKEVLSEFETSEGKFEIEGLKVRPNTVRDVIEIDEHINNMTLTGSDLELEIGRFHVASRYASLLDKSYGNILERTEYLENWFDSNEEDVVETTRQFIRFESASNHGVKNSITVKCEVCGVSVEKIIDFDPTSFFPEI